MLENLHPVLTVRLFGAEKCFGPGIAELLQKVEMLHSLRGAAAAMGMAYSKAWTLVKTCEERLGGKLLTSTTGGKNGGGATLTALGKDLVQTYFAYCEALEQVGKQLFFDHFSHIIDG